jgi:hypothetical protein
MWHDSDRRDDDESNFQRRHQHTPITIHNIRKLMLAEDLRPISANAILWYSLWWLDQTASIQ